MTSTALYFSPQPTRSARARWAYLEAGLPFEAHPVDVFKDEHKTESFRTINPLGTVPVSVIGGKSVVESSALALIAAAEGTESTLLPQRGTDAWRQALQWVVFGPAELDHRLANMNEQRLFLPPEARNPELMQRLVDELRTRAEWIARQLGDGPHLLGEMFTIADICIGHSLVWAQMHDQLVPHSTLQTYLERLQRRPAFQEVYGPRIEVRADPHAAA